VAYRGPRPPDGEDRGACRRGALSTTSMAPVAPGKAAGRRVSGDRLLKAGGQRLPLGSRELGVGVKAEPGVVRGRHPATRHRAGRSSCRPLGLVPLVEVEGPPPRVDMAGRPPLDRLNVLVPEVTALVAVAVEAGGDDEQAGLRTIPLGFDACRRIGYPHRDQLGQTENHDQGDHDRQGDVTPGVGWAGTLRHGVRHASILSRLRSTEAAP